MTYNYFMFDYITLASLIGLVVFGVLWSKASPRVWYYDSDNDPVSLKSVFGLLWLVCLATLIYQQIHYFTR